MGRLRRWLNVGLIGVNACLVAGCASDLPEWAAPRRSLAEEMSRPAPPLVRLQKPDGPGVTLQKPLLPPPDAPMVLPAAPPGFGTEQASLSTRGVVRVRVRAWVNGRPIFDEEVMEAAKSQALGEIMNSRGPDQAARLTQHFNTVLDGLIDQELMYQDAVKKLEKANRNALDKMREYVDQEFDKTLQRMRQAKWPEEEIKAREATNRRLLERGLIASEYARTRIKPGLDSINNLSEIDTYYQAHKNEFQTVDKIVWQDIFIPVSAQLPTVEDVKRFAEELINRCRTPDDFDRLMVYNEGDSKLRGGEGLGQVLGRKGLDGQWLAGEIRPMELEEPLRKLKAGQIGPVVPFSTGVHLIRVTKREYAGQMPLDDQVSKIIRRRLESELFEREARRIVRELRTRAVIRIERETP